MTRPKINSGCSVAGCERKYMAKGYCSKHYYHLAKREKKPQIAGPVCAILCKKCDTWKPANRFNKAPRNLIGHMYNCKDCEKKRLIYYGEEGNQRAKQWRKDNPERFKKSVKRWRANNPEVVKKVARDWINNHYRNDDNYRLSHLLRTRTNHAVRIYMKTGYIQKSNKKRFIDFGGIIEQLGECPGERGAGDGKWTIDHIIPLRLLDLTDPVQWRIGASKKNVRWLLWQDNYDRGQTWDEEAQELFEELLKEFTNEEV